VAAESAKSTRPAGCAHPLDAAFAVDGKRAGNRIELLDIRVALKASAHQACRQEYWAAALADAQVTRMSSPRIWLNGSDRHQPRAAEAAATTPATAARPNHFAQIRRSLSR
jgi:hypothetical protein